MAELTRVWKEGVAVGLIGAASVAAWFFVVDLVSGEPLYTPGVLGEALLNVIGDRSAHSTMFNAAVYTPFHVLAFVVVGMMVSRIVEAAKRVPSVTVGLLLLFVVFETAFYFMATYLAQFDTLGRLAWYQIGAANLLASVTMGTYLWRKHPELKREFRMALDERV
jgi:hypothetical protein